MPRLSPRVFIALALVIVAIAGLSAFVGPAGLAEVPSASAQTPPAQARNVEAMLYTSQVQWRTIPSARVIAELRDESGQMIALGTGLADDTGQVTIVFRGGRGPGSGQPGQPGQPGGGAAAIRSGYEIRLTPAGSDTVATKVPDLGVGASTAGDRVLMIGPGGAQLALSVTHGTGPGDTINQTVTLDGSGVGEFPMPGGTALDPDDYGTIALTTADANKFWARFDVLSVDVTIGARQASGVATLGADLAIELTAPDGSAKGSGSAEIIGEPSFEQPTGRNQRTFGPIEPGDTISVSQTGGLPGTDRTLTGVIPDLSVDVNLGTMEVEGSGPANSEIDIVVTSPYGETFTRSTTTDDTGHYTADLSDIRDFGRGWTAAAVYSPMPGLRVSVYKTVEQVRIGVHRSLVTGVAEPGGAITITVRAGDGTEKGTDTVRVGGQGTFQTTFTGSETIEFGDSVEVAFVVGDPVSIFVAPVSAKTNPQTDVVSGVAPAGTSVRASHGSGNNQEVALATSDAAGEYAADFTGILDLVAPMYGDLIVRLPSGHELFTGWAAVQMTMELGQSFLTGNGPEGRLVTAQLLDEDLIVVATGEAEVFTQGGFNPNQPGGRPGTGGVAVSEWDLDFEDTLGSRVDVEPGDTVRATVGDDSFEVKVPPLSGVAFVADDLVNGSTTPSRALTLRVQRVLTGETTYVDLVADSDGNFTHQFGDEFDLQHNDAILLTTLQEGHIVNSRFFVPGLRLNLDTASLSGSWRPDTVIAYELRGPSGLRASGTTTTESDATFRVLLESPSGDRAVPNEGDTLTVEPLSGAAEAPLVLEIPELTITWDVETNVMGGRAVPGGHLAFFVEDVIGRGFGGPERRRVDPEIDPDGSYTATYFPPYNLEPGIQMQAIYRVPSGHLVVRTRYAPLLNVQHGGANICGFSNPRTDVSARLSSQTGSQIATARALADYNSRYAALLLDGKDAPVTTEVSQTVRASLAGEDIEMLLPRLNINVDWETGRVRGQGPPNSTFMVLWPARGCLDTSDRQMMRGRTNAQGQFNSRAVGIDPGQGFEVAYFIDDGHRMYVHVFRSVGQIYIYTNRITGRTTPLSRVTAELVGADGTPKGKASTRSDTDGWYDMVFKGGSGGEVTSAPGDKVLLAASGENPEIVVEDLLLDWSLGEPILGTAPPNREVEISISFDDMPPARFTLMSSDAGTFRFDETDVPPRSEWDLDDVRGIRAVLETLEPPGHEIIYEAGAEVPGPGPGPVPTPPVDRGHDIFVPRVVKNG